MKILHNHGVRSARRQAATTTAAGVEHTGRESHATCLLVLGMHRSGTSAMARLLSLAGARLPLRLMKRSASNERGHWEPEALVAYHDRLLADIGSSWHDWHGPDFSRMPPGRSENIKREIADIIAADFPGADLFVVKDPRICRFVPLVIEALSDAGIRVVPILTFRNPLDVMRSLEKRKEAWPTDYSQADAALLWLRHVLDADAATRDLPRAIVSYEGLLRDWRGAFASIVRQTGIDFGCSADEIAPMVEEFLSPDLRHHRHSTEDVLLNPALHGWVGEAYSALRILEESPGSKEALSELDSIRKSLNRALPVLIALTDRSEAERLAKELTRIEAQQVATQTALVEAKVEATNNEAALTQELERTREELGKSINAADGENSTLFRELTAAKAELSRQLAEAQAAHTTEADRAKRLESSAATLQREISEIRAHLSEAETLNLAYRNSTSWRLTAPVRAAKTVPRGIARAVRATRAAVRFGGGVLPSMRKAVRVLRREGWTGVKWRLNYAAMTAHLNEAEQYNVAYRNSTSWRLTAPVRAAKTVPMGIASAVGTTSAAVRVGGGLLPTIAKTIQVYRTEGLAGVRWRIAYAQSAWPTGVSFLTAPVSYLSKDARVSDPPSLQTPGQTSAQTPVEHNDAISAFLDQIFSIAPKSRGISTEYVPKVDQPFDLSGSPLKLIAFYLPQFHPIPENDEWWGKGFTEWTNVSKATPQFVGHYQPHLPGELGFYDLRLVDIQRQQIELAKHYGIYGFCYHHYWFGGKRLLERPFNQILANPDLDLPFCLCWANENWTRRWDGLENDVLMAQNHSPDDDFAFIADIAPALRDPRYIRFNGRPVLIVYRVSLLPEPQATAQRWRDYCRREGIGDLYLVAARSFGIKDPRPFGFDAAVEFPPHEAHAGRINHELQIVSPHYKGNVFDYADMVGSYLAINSEDYPTIKTVCPGWDNEARKPAIGSTFHGASPESYAKWLRGAAEYTLKKLGQDRSHPPFVFVNAWNEWAEGTHLEPDRRFGYANLHASANVARDFIQPYPEVSATVRESQERFAKRAEKALVVHLHYDDLFAEIRPYMEAAGEVDLFVSIRADVRPECCRELVSAFPDVRLAIYPNRGRDIQPFLQTLRLLRSEGYELACKVHSKKSPQRMDGERLRRAALNELLGSKSRVAAILKQFDRNPKLGIVGPKGSLLDLSEPDRNVLNRYWLDRLFEQLSMNDLVGNYDCSFVAGSMFWFRPNALARLDELNLEPGQFEDELGQVDGTLAHAVERLFTPVAERDGFMVATLERAETHNLADKTNGNN